jgi:hypothetical protein
MQGNDIAGFFSPRVLVHADVVLDYAEETTKVLGIFNRKHQVRVPNKQAMAHLWRFSTKVNVLLELFSEDPESVLNAMMDEMDARGSNPFRYVEGSIDIPTLARDLAYRPDVMGVIDLPSRRLMYGSRYLDLDELNI